MNIIGKMRRTLALRSRLRGIGYRIRHAAETPVERAIGWIQEHRIPGQGIPPNHTMSIATPEVTGYTIPTLYDYGEKELARDFARWEVSVQRPDGAICAPGTDVPYTFDTAQLIRGLLAVLDDMPELEDNLRRACEYVARHIADDGNVLHDSYKTWEFPDGIMLSEYGNLYVLPPLLEAARKLSEPRYEQAARRAVEYFKRKTDLVQWKHDLGTLSHYWGYMMEALVDVGETALAGRGLDQAAALQGESGVIPAYPGADWVCSTGMAQLAIAWYKLGIQEPADKAVKYLETIQNPSGGFYGGYGQHAQYFPREEIAWAVKFFLDACHWRAKCDFDREVGDYQESIDESDGRVQEILSFLGDLNGTRVIDVGCGKGRYLRVLQERFPQASLCGLDFSTRMLESCPQGVETQCGTLLNIRYPDASFDSVYSVEAVEHAMLAQNAIREMVRVLKPGGKIIIIDKSAHQLGRLATKPWEQWFTPKGLVALLQTQGVQAQCKPVPYEHHTEPDGLFLAWEGVKRA